MPKYSTNLPTTPYLRSISVTVSTRSVAVTPSLQRAGQAHADDVRRQQRQRLVEHRRLGLDAADAPAEHAEPVDHRGVRVGADERVRQGDRLAVASSSVCTTLARNSRFTWCTMPAPGGTTRKLRKAFCAQRRKA